MTARCFCPPDSSPGYFVENRDAGARPTRSSAATAVALRRSRSSGCRPWIRSASEIARPTVIDGLSEACGSWNTICSLRRSGRSWRSRSRPMLLAAVGDGAAGRPDQPEQRAAEGRLARAGLADHAEHLALREVEVDAVDRA